MKRLAVVPVLLIALAGCAAQPEADPMVTCIDVSVEYGLAAGRAEAADICVWLQDHEARLDPHTFDETFSDSDLAQAWAKSELEKSN